MTLMATDQNHTCSICGNDVIDDDIFGGVRHVMNSFDWLHKATLMADRLDDDCTCIEYCDEDPRTACSLSGTRHVHPASMGEGFGPCPVHPDSPGDL